MILFQSLLIAILCSIKSGVRSSNVNQTSNTNSSTSQNIVNTSEPVVAVASNFSNSTQNYQTVINSEGKDSIATNIRTAVIISGQLRTANITFTSGHMKKTREFFWFGATDAPTPALTIIENLFKVLHRQGNFDVFMHVSADPKLNQSWDGSPWTYQEQLFDTRGCRVFSSHVIFHGTGNNFFCLIEPERELLNNFLSSKPQWETYYYVRKFGDLKKKEQLLQQLYSQYKGNLGATQYALMQVFFFIEEP